MASEMPGIGTGAGTGSGSRSGPSGRAATERSSSMDDRDYDHKDEGDDDRDRDDRDHDDDDHHTNSGQPPRKRQRVRLSCLECRRRKLSCDRGFPCERCVKSGTPEHCTYETRPGLAPPAKNGLSPSALATFDSRLSSLTSGHHRGGGSVSGHADTGLGLSYRRDSSHRPGATSGGYHLNDGDRMRRLELEVAQLKSLLAVAVGAGENGANGVNGANGAKKPTLPAAAAAVSDGSTTVLGDEDSPQQEKQDGNRDNGEPSTFLQHIYGPRSAAAMAVGDELRFFRGKEFKTRYFGPHNACMAFRELTGLCPFMKETAEEWLRPLHMVHHATKDRQKRKREREERELQPDLELEALLPEREEMDDLVNIYLDQFEQIHRIVHIPSFWREYTAFWKPGGPRPQAFTALLLSIMSISSCLRGNTTGKFIGMTSHSHYMAVKWIAAVDAWSQRQSQKHRKLVHYQIACLSYLAKRVNTVKKKRFWKASGALTQDAVSVGLHREPSHISGSVSVYNQEMRRRIWATIQEFDMQAAFDHGLPTLQSALRSDVLSPRNLFDEDFDEDSTELPPSRPTSEYTLSSYQSLSHQSLPLRLQLSRVLTGRPDDLDYDQVIRYTNDITHEIDALPSWDVPTTKRATLKQPGGKRGGKDELEAPNTDLKLAPLLAYTLLHIQLRQYIIPLHQPFLKLRKTNSKYQYSEIIYYNAARDMVLLHDKLAEQGVQTLNFLREDALTLAINLCSVTMLQSRGSTNMIMVNSQHTKKLLEKCLAMKEDCVLRCGNNEPWGYSIMCAAAGLLEAHLGDKTPEAAKAWSAERFVNLHYRLLASQEQSACANGANGGGSGNDSSANDTQQQQGGAVATAQAQAQPGQQQPPAQPPQLPTVAQQPQSQFRPPNFPKPNAPLPPVETAALGALPTAVGPAAGPYMTLAPGSSAIIPPPEAPPEPNGPPSAWWLLNMANMANTANSNGTQPLQPPQPAINPDFNFELLNSMNLGNLWADYSWEDM